MNLVEMLIRILNGRSEAPAHRRAARIQVVSTERLLRQNSALLKELRQLEDEVRTKQ